MMRGDINELKRALAGRVLSVCQILMPDGKPIGAEYVYDPGHGKIKVALKGTKQGVWSHFGGDEKGGDLIDLWMAIKSQTLVEALDDIRSYLGIEKPSFDHAPNRAWVKPKKPPCTAPKAAVLDYLTVNRNINGHVLDVYKIGEQGNNIIFPFIRNGELVMAKARPAVDGGKPKPTEAGCEKILFGWQAIPPDARTVVITEGEIDALSMFDYGYPALSVPFGGGTGNKQDWIESEYDALSRFETIYLAMDNDKEGQLAVAEIAKRLGHHRVRVVALPRKDANACLTDGVTKEEITACIAAAKTMDPEGLRRPNEYADRVIELFWPSDETKIGYRLPWADAGTRMLFRPGEVTVWSGASGSGKSQILSHAAVGWIEQGSRICVASLEMAPAQTLKRMVKQASNTDRPTEPMIRQCLEWISDGVLLFDLVGKAKVDTLLEVFDYARARYGCDQFVIDSLMRLGLLTDDYNGQEAVMFRLVDWAILADVHLHLVAHSRKANEQRAGVPGTEDIKGAMEIGANAFNIITVARNRQREEAEQNGRPEDDDGEYDKIMAKAGVVLNVAKQRNGDWEGLIGLWFNQATYQYRSKADSPHGRHYTDLPRDVDEGF